MKRTRLSLGELALIAGTRVALGGGAGLLLGEKLTGNKRRAIGWTLLTVGAVSTIPLGILALSRRR